jgi:hypothetical protein
MRLSDLRNYSAALVALFLGTNSLTGCTSQPSANEVGDLPAGGAAAPYQSSYVYDPMSADPDGMRPDSSAWGQSGARLKHNETLGFGAGQLLIFNYKQQFDCVIGPFSDFNSIGKPADETPQQFASPECAIGFASKLSPSGASLAQTDPLYILVPFFETNKKTGAFSKPLGKALKKLFGFVPDAFKPDPGVPVQCPAPADMPATCTMHPLQINLGPVVAQLGLISKGTNLYVPLVNHDHLLNNATINQSAEWWKLIIVLVENPKAWPNASGTSGITSISKLRAAQADKEASADVPSNFFLYFSSYTTHSGASSDRMPGMHM